MAVTAGQKLRTSDLNLGANVVQTLGGQFRSSTSGGVTTVESTVLTTPTVNLLANTTYLIEYCLYWTTTVTGDIIVLHIRDTNSTGTSRAATVPFAAISGGGGPYPGYATALLQTSTAAAYNAVGTVMRNTGSGTVTALANSSLVISQLGPNANFTTV